MTHPLPLETIKYERRSNVLIRIALQRLISKADDIISAIDGTTDQFEPETAALSSATSEAQRLLSESENGRPESSKTIALRIEGGLVADVTGIPAGYELRVEDYDVQDPGDDSWDAEKECAVTDYGGDSA
jgi:hypothetical protein